MLRVAPALARRWLWVLFALAFLCCAVLRLSWASDMEYKGDEQWTFERARQVTGMQQPWRATGMDSSVGPANPGMSWFVFAGLAKVARVETPLGLVRAVIMLNVAAFALLLFFASKIVARDQREAWLWAGALAAVSPMAVLLERKIWPPSVLPVFCVLSLMGFWRRGRYWGAALWGFAGALLGQIHISGFFFAAAFFAWEVLFGEILSRVVSPPEASAERERPARARTKWLGWIGGSVVGAVPLLPWLGYLRDWHAHTSLIPQTPAPQSLLFLRLWLTDTFGLGLDYNLGGDYSDFLHWTWPHTTLDYSTVYLLGSSFAMGAYLFAAAARSAWSRRAAWRTLPRVIVHASDTSFVCAAGLVGYGALISCAGPIRQHYMTVLFPLEWLACAWCALGCVRRPRALLVSLWTVQLALSVTLLAFLHQNHGAPKGDYGSSYATTHPPPAPAVPVRPQRPR